jgi:hypothetical protein
MSQQNALPDKATAQAMAAGVAADVKPTSQQFDYWYAVLNTFGGQSVTHEQLWAWDWPIDVKLARMAILNQYIGTL